MFHILTDFTLFLLVCLKINYYLCGTTTFCIKQNKNLLWFLTDSILIYNVLKITSSIPKVFILIKGYLVFCLKNNAFVVTVQTL